jgi:hypothetical protein
VPAIRQDWYDRENVAKEAEDLADQINRIKSRYNLRVFSDLEHGGTGFLVFSESVATAVSRGFVCKSPWSSFVSHLDGVVRPCCFNMSASYGNLNQDSVEQLWNGAETQRFRKAMKELRYLEVGCSPSCPDLAMQLQNDGADAQFPVLLD